MKPINLKLIILFALAIFSVNTDAQVPIFEWASNQQFVGTFRERSITTDSNENVIITGYFSGNHDFDPSPADLIIQAVGSTDFYVIKLDPSGNLLWVKTFPSTAAPSASNKAYSVVVDSSDNIYVSGSYYGPIDFDPGPGVFTLAPVTAVSLGFLFSLDPNGDFRWVKSLPMYGNTSTDTHDMAYGEDGSIIVADRFSNTLDFDLGPGVFQMTASSIGDLYVLKMDLDGDFIWARSFEGEFQANYAIAAHSSGNIFLAGYYSFGADLNPGPGTLNVTPVGLWDSYVIKLNSSGDLIWGKTFGGPDHDEPNEIVVDAQQNVYISGLFTGTSDFDPGIGVAAMTSEGNDDPFLLKLDSNGDFEWAHNYGGGFLDFKISICTDPTGNVYATGRYTDTLDFQPGPGIYNQIAGPTSSSLFITKLNTNGLLKWVKSFDGISWKIGTSIHHAPSGNFYVAGEYDETIDFNPGFGNAIYTSVGGRDGFNLKYSQCNQTIPLPDVTTLSDVTANCSIDSLVTPMATEFCLGAIVGVPNVTFPITTQGTTVVTWTYDAGDGFVATQTQNIIITDTDAPIPDVTNLADVSYVCSTSSLTPPTATDNCSNSITVTNDASFPLLSNTIVTWTYGDNNGNMSTQTQNVVITPIDNGISQTGGATLEADASGYSYQWIECDNGNAAIVGATNQSFIAIDNGNYAVEISNGICAVTSNCLAISDVSISELDNESIVSIFPNPSTGKVRVNLNTKYQSISVEIKDALGRSVNNYTFNSTELFEIELGTNGGLYFIEVTSDDEKTIVGRVIKN